jgi:chloramphenicol 3-O phosphotransferase
MTVPGQIVILNGVPRSGKSAIAKAIQDGLDGTWLSLGVDASMRSTPERFQPGIGLRPGGERPDLEELVTVLYAALYESVAAHARIGVNVVVDVGHHEFYSKPLHILRDSARRLNGLPVLFVGVRCPIDAIWQRREQTWGQKRETADETLLAAVERWQSATHAHGAYDLEIDTSVLTPVQSAQIISNRLAGGPPGTALERLAALRADAHSVTFPAVRDALVS